MTDNGNPKHDTGESCADDARWPVIEKRGYQPRLPIGNKPPDPPKPPTTGGSAIESPGSKTPREPVAGNDSGTTIKK